MNVPRGTTVRAAAVAARLLEDEGLDFYSVLQTSEGNLTISGATPEYEQTAPIGDGYSEGVGQLEVWWSVEFETRNWGIKDIVPHVKKLVLDGWFQEANADGDMIDTKVTFHFEYPKDSDFNLKIGSDPDAPTPDNVYRLAKPKWKVEAGIDRYRKERTTFVPQAEVDLSKRIIEILF